MMKKDGSWSKRLLEVGYYHNNSVCEMQWSKEIYGNIFVTIATLEDIANEHFNGK